MKESAAEIFMFVKQKRKVWLIKAKWQQENFVRRLSRIKTVKQAITDVFLGYDVKRESCGYCF